MEANVDVKSTATHEVVMKADEAIAFQGTGQECADFQYQHNGNRSGMFVRRKTQN